MRLPEHTSIGAAELATLLERLLHASDRTEEGARARLSSNVVVAEQQAAICRRVAELLRQAEDSAEPTYFSTQQRDEVQRLIRILRLQLTLDEIQ
jgi:hypothetical protein